MSADAEITETTADPSTRLRSGKLAEKSSWYPRSQNRDLGHPAFVFGIEKADRRSSAALRSAQEISITSLLDAAAASARSMSFCAASKNAVACGLLGPASVTGKPRSPPSRIAGINSIDPRNGTLNCLAVRSAPPLEKMSISL